MNGMRALPFLAMLVAAFAPFAYSQNAADVEAVISTDLGTFRIEFFPDKAPKHAAQFLADARSGYYEGSAFFRVWANGLIQGGDPLLKDATTPRVRWGSGGFNRVPTESNDLKQERGTVSSVNRQAKPNSDGSQFFVCLSPQPALQGKYTVFAHVVEGMDVVEQISRTPVDAGGLAQKPVRILKISIEPKKKEPFADAPPDGLRRVVTLNTTLGAIQIEMEPDWAPHTVQRFLMLCTTGWYDHTAFHRLVKGFVLQGGSADTRASGPNHPADRWVTPLKAEFRPDVKHVRGIVSMAHGGDPNSATTSFFIVLGPAPNLDGKFAAFGKVVGGMDVLDAFEKEDVDGEKPKRRLEIMSTSIGPAVQAE